MKIKTTYSHMNGLEWIMVHEPKIWKEIKDIILSIDATKHRTKISKERTMAGRLLYSPKGLNARLKAAFAREDWKKSRTDFWLTDDYDLTQEVIRLPDLEQKEKILMAKKTPIHSYNETDFVKKRIAVEVQFGKYSFIAYDLFVKHQAFFIARSIDLGIEILPMKSMVRGMSSGPGYYEMAIHQLARQGRGVPSVPLILIGVEP
jgi:hypothetical protein